MTVCGTTNIKRLSNTNLVGIKLQRYNYSRLTKAVLLLASENELELKSKSMSAMVMHMLLTSFLYTMCKIMGCIKGKIKEVKNNSIVKIN